MDSGSVGWVIESKTLGAVNLALKETDQANMDI